MGWAAVTALVLSIAAVPGRVGEFTAKSGDDRVLDRSRIRGKVVLAFYEADGEQEINATLKAELKTFNETQLTKVERLMVVPFADVSRIIWPFKGVAAGKLDDASKEVGLTIYGDWDGSVRAGFGFTEGTPNLMVIDDKGIIRLRAAGKVQSGDFDKIKKLIKKLVDGEPVP